MSTVAQARRKPAGLSWQALPDWVQQAIDGSSEGHDTDLVWLHEERIVEPLIDGGVRATNRYVAKVLDPEGVEDAAYCSVAYRSEDAVERLSAWAVLPERTVRIPERGAAHDQPYLSDGAGFEDSRLRWVRAPGVVPGGFAACESVVTHALDIGADSFFFGFASRPTVTSRYVVKVPETWKAGLVRIRANGLDCQEQPRGATCTASDIEPLPPRALRPPSQRLLPLVWVRWSSPDGSRGYRDWNAVGRWFEQLAGPVLKEAGEATEIGQRLAPRDDAEILEALARAFDFAAREVRYVSIQIGIGGYKPFSPAKICDLRYGDCKAKSFLMRALVGQWGVETFPVLIRTRDRGEVARDVPTPGQFNHAIVAVRLSEGVGDDLWSVREVEGFGRLVFLDPTVRNGSPWDLPWAVQGTIGLMVHPDGGLLVEIPEQPPTSSSQRVVLRARVDEQGAMSEGSLERTWTGAEAVSTRYRYSGMRVTQRETSAKRRIQDRFPGASVTEYGIEGLDDPYVSVVESMRLEGARIGRRVGPLLFVESGASESLFPALPKSWEWSLWLDPPSERTVEVHLALPGGWAPEEMPPRLEIATTDLIARAAWTLEETGLSYRRSVVLLSSEIPPERIAEFRDAVLKIGGADAYTVALVPQ